MMNSGYGNSNDYDDVVYGSTSLDGYGVGMDHGVGHHPHHHDDPNMFFSQDDDLDNSSSGGHPTNKLLLHVNSSADGDTLPEINFDDPKIAGLPRILLMGPRRGGKTSVQRVVFQKMSPHETLFRLEATQGLERAVVDHTPLCKFTIWDFPGDYYGEDSDSVFVNSSTNNNDNNNPSGLNGNNNNNDNMFMNSAGNISLIFVVDAQDEPYDHVLQSFTSVVTRALQANPTIAVEVFINKVDGELFLSDESKYDCRRDIMQQVTEELSDAGFSPDSIQVRYHLTSIYDHSIYEALSRVVQRLIPQLPTLENLLNVLVSTCSMEKAYLFDVVSKLYISTDSGPVDMQSVELCSDMIDVVLDVSGIYGLGPSTNQLAMEAAAEEAAGKAQTSGSGSTAEEGSGEGDPAAAAAAATGTTAQNSTKRIAPPSSSGATEDGGATDIARISNSSGSAATTTIANHDPTMAGLIDELEEEMVDPDSAYDSESASVIRLSSGMVLYLKEVDTMLALVCITRSENFRKKSLINYNIGCLKKALRALAPKTTNTNNTIGSYNEYDDYYNHPTE